MGDIRNDQGQFGKTRAQTPGELTGPGADIEDRPGESFRKGGDQVGCDLLLHHGIAVVFRGLTREAPPHEVG